MRDLSVINRSTVRDMVQSTVAKLRFISNPKKPKSRQRGILKMKSLLVALDEDSVEEKPNCFKIQDNYKVHHHTIENNILMKGILKNLQSNKDQLFVLYKKGYASIARLESYENIKQPDYPSKVIFLSDCFDVVRTSIKRNPFTIILFTKSERISISADTERDCMLWLTAIEQEREVCGSYVYNEPKYLKSWIVNVRCRGNFSLKGWYLLGVTLTQLDFVSRSISGVVSSLAVKSIERSGYTENSFYMEIWICNVTCLLWLDMEDPQSACSIDQLIKQLTGKGKKSFTDSPLLQKSHKEKAKNATQVNLLSKALLYSPDKDEISSASSLCSSYSNYSDFNKSSQFKNSTSSVCSSPEFQPKDQNKQSEPFFNSSASKHCCDIRDAETNDDCFSTLYETSTSSSFADDESEVFLDLEQQAINAKDLTSVYQNPTYVKFDFPSKYYSPIHAGIEERQKRSKFKTLLRRRFSKKSQKANLRVSFEPLKNCDTDLHTSILTQLEFRPSTSVFRSSCNFLNIKEDSTVMQARTLKSDSEPVYESVQIPPVSVKSNVFSPNGQSGINSVITFRRNSNHDALPPIPPQRISSNFPVNGIDQTDFFYEKMRKDPSKDSSYEDVSDRSYEIMFNRSTTPQKNTIAAPLTPSSYGYEQMNVNFPINENRSFEETCSGHFTSVKKHNCKVETAKLTNPKCTDVELTENDNLNPISDSEDDSYAKISPSPRDFHPKDKHSTAKNPTLLKDNNFSLDNPTPNEYSSVFPKHFSSPTQSLETSLLTRKQKFSPNLNSKLNLSLYTNVSPPPHHNLHYSVPYQNQTSEVEFFYANRSCFEDSVSPEYESMLFPKKLDDTTYDNIDNHLNIRSKPLAYADVLIGKSQFNNDKKKGTSNKDECNYIKIDFEKSQGVREAIKDLRSKQSPTNLQSSSDNKNEYLTDLSYKTFRKLHNT